MSKLKNAPLLEVIFELRWKPLSQDDLQKYQYLHGDLYALLREVYKFRESLAPPEFPVDIFIGKPMHRFRKEANGYPLFQSGPGVLTLNTTDDAYDWDEYSTWCDQLLSAFYNVYFPSPEEKFSPTLLYFDFFPMNIKEQNVLEFLENNFNFNIKQSFLPQHQQPINFNWGIAYPIELGQMGVNVNMGLNGKKEEGLILQTTINGPELDSKQAILEWLDTAHTSCAKLFKEITEGQLYESFK